VVDQKGAGVKIQKVGVVGCGIMGSGIAEVCVRAGYAVVVHEVSQQFADRGMSRIQSSLEKAMEKGKLTEQDKSSALSRLQVTLSMEDFKDCDFVVEAVPENLEEKRKVFATLDKVCAPHTVMASNTSCLSITDIAVATKRPAQVVGLHFFNPVPVMKLVEVVKTIVTTDEVVGSATAFCESIGKKTILCKDAPGFLANRLGLILIFASMRAYEQGMATKEEIDLAMKLGWNHPMGPLELADLLGLDTLYFIASSMYEDLKDPLYCPPVILKKMVTAGQLGRKTRKGFYQYDRP
jgi:3-hydroxybutyryl-CoA dehydrogenase